ncbi:sensor histidine kinase [Paramaledivibacter caminithermalis]|jgi:sensor histidine kinase YesM|uniref:Sensor_kinase_SpoOB-type, alpha-helical domain n=1 Tax=Paramaledivibacter caminithermalis (strain DSM 15212 / CIP 107654 / DViRD3) TaxID=1121301 RepID=A0A1M6TPY7_PARC5|nr:GHKL domain-containing protein [Paramaledivibacter caminithermalis]SHK58996.1 Sensor_kinase_SpoOB-type, alpha-helical domain [Paramaledivibacter caminithermalis DSM 15212]
MNNWLIINYIFAILDVALMFYFTDKFLTRRKVNNKQILIIILLQIGINYYINHELGTANLLGLVIMVFTTAILFNKIFKERFIYIGLFITLGIVLSSIVEMLVTILIMFITNKDSTIFFTNNICRISGAITSKIILYLLIKQLGQKIKYKIANYFKKTQIYQLLFVLVLNIIVIFSAIYFYKNTNVIRGNEKRHIAILSVGIIMFTIAILEITKKIMEYAVKEIEWNLKEREYKRQTFYMKNMDDMFKNIRAQRHDFNHHIGCIYGLINMEEFEKIKEYIEKLTKETAEYNEIINVGNPILASLLNTKITKAKKKKIKVDIDIDINTNISIECIDISIIIGNLLDNAIEACEKVEEDNRYIEVNIYTKMNNLIIKVANSKLSEIELERKINNEGFTTKSDAENHGFGLTNIKQTVEKYRGIIKIEDESNIFKINIAIPIEDTL